MFEWLIVCSAIDWRLVQYVPCLSPQIIWDILQLTCALMRISTTENERTDVISHKEDTVYSFFFLGQWFLHRHSLFIKGSASRRTDDFWHLLVNELLLLNKLQYYKYVKWTWFRVHKVVSSSKSCITPFFHRSKNVLLHIGYHSSSYWFHETVFVHNLPLRLHNY